MSEPATGTIEPPSPTGLGREVRVLRELPRLLVRLPRLRREPRGEGEPVMAVPGFGASDASLWALRRYLLSLGYRPRGRPLLPSGGGRSVEARPGSTSRPAPSSAVPQRRP